MMKLIAGNTYNYHYSNIAERGEQKGQRVEGNFKVNYDGIIDATGYQCDHCGKDLKKGHYFLDDAGSQYFFGSECVKKVISK